jgi:hypothetical protein
MTPADGTTALTDAGLALLVLAGTVWLHRSVPSSALRTTWIAALGAFGLAAALGAVAHGLSLPAATLELLWQPLFLSLGIAVALFAAAAVGAAWGDGASRAARPYLLASAGGFYLLTRLTHGDFLVFVVYQGVGILFALGVHARLAMGGRIGAGWVAAGLVISLAAGAAQAVDTLSFELVWTFDHNGVYHLLQGGGLAALLVGLRRMLARTDTTAA